VGKIAEKAVCNSVFLTTWHCILNAELTKTHSYWASFFSFFIQPSRENYRKVFAVAAGLCAFGGTFFMVFLSGEEQSWNNPGSTKRLDNEEGGEKETRGIENYQMDATDL